MSTTNDPPKPATADAPAQELTPEEQAAAAEAEKDKAITE
jgi:hypothetical protein